MILELRSCGVVIFLLGVIVPDDRKDSIVKASVYMPREEYVEYKIDAVKAGSKVSSHLLRLIRTGKAVSDLGWKTLIRLFIGKYVFGNYDYKDVLKAARGETPDIEEVSREIDEFGRGLTLTEYRRRLLKMREACREGKRLIEIREEVIAEKLDEVEHLIKRFGEEHRVGDSEN